MAGRRVLVTGAARGIGALLSRRLHARGGEGSPGVRGGSCRPGGSRRCSRCGRSLSESSSDKPSGGRRGPRARPSRTRARLADDPAAL